MIFALICLVTFLGLLSLLLVWSYGSSLLFIYKRNKILRKIPTCWPAHWLWGHMGQDNKLDMFMLWFSFAYPFVVIAHPRLMKQLLKEPKSKPVYCLLDPWLGEGLLLSNGDKWFKNRRLLIPAFHVQVLNQYMTTFNSCTQELIAKWESKMLSQESFSIFEDASLLTLDVILQTAFGHKSHCQNEQQQSEYVKCITYLSVATINRLMTPYFRPDVLFYMSPTGIKYRRAVRCIHQRTEEVIQERRNILLKEEEQKKFKKSRRMDLLDVLLTAKDEDGVGMPDDQIRNEVNTFLFEGHDTTASALAWSLYCLAKYPEHQEKCRQEVMQVFGGKTELQWEDLKSLEYTTLCIKEAMRLYSPVPVVSRQTTEDMYLDGYFIPKGTSCRFNIFAMHRNPRVWDNPEVYDPLRFTPENSKDRDAFAYAPFSAGPRNCIGQLFAFNELRAVVATILKRFVIAVDPEYPPKMLSVLILKSTQGMWLKFTAAE